ncbi:acyltransferase family protein [Acinetobacter baumannii]|uniref:acyltransferase family protein n=1 Tax=Acinetobacter baumannii TaxID=470 RepID=UPI00233F3139|nr:acyltransferase family protein [Acinetobacter baumannii]MDC4325672.1 acyltransferase [Acinetobacter baumannii]MDC4836349.1 acyltransferase [Acinetobacter baumannii]MDC5485734.1 acyltransferase [Acinetobacter baumannii]MDK2187073.1 acyltransferase family protein [Acinetobacter baumannii]MDK2259882.1 acyltransferase family protein [Acinetobacter baumannii]
MSNSFRYDINGLRAYAVILVVLFHFEVLGFTGGFIGVDIFFVISGLLMTKNIIYDLENKSFNAFKFYLFRANRIIPTLVFLCLTILLIGWYTLTPLELQNYLKHAISSLEFISNIQYLEESGYFDTNSKEKILLHTWSLSVEWQFYIILPLLLVLLNKLSRSQNILKIFFVLLFIVSFTLSILISKSNPSAAFYLLPTRAWEMMAGGLIFLLFRNLTLNYLATKIIELTGFILILISLTIFTGATLWPSYNALLPVLGTFLILLANNNNSIFTNNKICQFLGNSSYSIYLWHWPIVFYLSYFEKENNIIYITLSIALSIFLGYISYKIIEIPSRKWLSQKKINSGYLITFTYLFISISFFSFLYLKDGLIKRFPQNIQIMIEKGNEKNPLFTKCQIGSGENVPECKYGNGNIKLIVIGDSHAEAMIPAIQKALPQESALIDWTYSGCPTVENIKKINNPDFKCGEVISKFTKKIKKYPHTPILIINRINVLFHGAKDGDSDIVHPIRYIDKPFKAYNAEYEKTMKEAYINTLCKFSENNEVYVTRPIPEFPVNVPKILVHREIMRSSTPLTITKEAHIKRSRLAWDAQDEAAKKCGIKILDTTNFFCDQKICYSENKEIPLYFDDDHLNLYGARILTPLFRTIFN